MRALLAKEMGELAREKRFAAFLTMLAVILGFGGALLFHEAAQSAENGYGFSFREPILALLFVGLVSCMLLAITFAADAVAKERDQGMLPILLTSPVTHRQVLGAKIVMLLVVYGAYALLNLVIAAIASFAFGWVVLKTAFWLMVLPLGAFYVFTAGLCLLLSTVFRTSKASIAVAVGAVLPQFLIIRNGPIGYLLASRQPAAYEMLGWFPVDAAITAATALAQGATFSAAPLVLATAMGAGLAGAAFLTFHAREVGL